MSSVYVPEHFHAKELFPQNVVDRYGVDHSSGIWRLIDFRVVWTLDMLRERFGTVVVNDYMWGGKNQYRGYRPFTALLDLDHYEKTGEVKASWSTFTSQHCFGRAADSKFKKVSAEEVRQDIRNNPDAEIYKYITAVEDKVSWFHFDCRNILHNGVFFFNS